MNTFTKGDVIKWTWDENGIAVAGGTGLILDHYGMVMQRTPYDIIIQNLAEIRPSRINKIGNIFSDEGLKSAYSAPQ